MQPIKIILSGGGTGGHIFPAVTIANELKKIIPNAEFLFVGAIGRMEMEKVPKAGYEIIGLPIAGFQRRLTLSNFIFPFLVIKSLLKARRIINDFKPNVVIGTGGYASGPILRAATSKGIPTLIQEQNSYAGITNKILSAKV
ncbi:MAG TPA: glycosyltransferase, partial [Cytophaga sp.]|nr:glycosyltransferase [Cytophaga sp.]